MLHYSFCYARWRQGALAWLCLFMLNMSNGQSAVLISQSVKCPAGTQPEDGVTSRPLSMPRRRPLRPWNGKKLVSLMSTPQSRPGDLSADRCKAPNDNYLTRSRGCIICWHGTLEGNTGRGWQAPNTVKRPESRSPIILPGKIIISRPASSLSGLVRMLEADRFHLPAGKYRVSAQDGAAYQSVRTWTPWMESGGCLYRTITTPRYRVVWHVCCFREVLLAKAMGLWACRSAAFHVQHPERRAVWQMRV